MNPITVLVKAQLIITVADLSTLHADLHRCLHNSALEGTDVALALDTTIREEVRP